MKNTQASPQALYLESLNIEDNCVKLPEYIQKLANEAFIASHLASIVKRITTLSEANEYKIGEFALITSMLVTLTIIKSKENKLTEATTLIAKLSTSKINKRITDEITAKALITHLFLCVLNPKNTNAKPALAQLYQLVIGAIDQKILETEFFKIKIEYFKSNLNITITSPTPSKTNEQLYIDSLNMGDDLSNLPLYLESLTTQEYVSTYPGAILERIDKLKANKENDVAETVLTLAMLITMADTLIQKKERINLDKLTKDLRPLKINGMITDSDIANIVATHFYNSLMKLNFIKDSQIYTAELIGTFTAIERQLDQKVVKSASFMHMKSALAKKLDDSLSSEIAILTPESKLSNSLINTLTLQTHILSLFGEIDKAIENYLKILNANPIQKKHISITQSRLAGLYVFKKQYDEALKYAEMSALSHNAQGISICIALKTLKRPFAHKPDNIGFDMSANTIEFDPSILSKDKTLQYCLSKPNALIARITQYLLTHLNECDLTIITPITQEQFANIAANPENTVKKLICSSDFFEKHKDSLAKISTLECLIEKSESGEKTHQYKSSPNPTTPPTSTNQTIQIINSTSTQPTPQTSIITSTPSKTNEQLYIDSLNMGDDLSNLPLYLESLTTKEYISTYSNAILARIDKLKANKENDVAETVLTLAMSITMADIFIQKKDQINLNKLTKDLLSFKINGLITDSTIANKVATHFYNSLIQINFINDHINTKSPNLLGIFLQLEHLLDQKTIETKSFAQMKSVLAKKLDDSLSNEFTKTNAPYNIANLTYHAFILSLFGEVDKAIENYLKILNATPDKNKHIALAQAKLAHLYIVKERYDEALKYSEMSALKNNPTGIMLYTGLKTLKRPIICSLETGLDSVANIVEFDPSIFKEDKTLQYCLSKPNVFIRPITQYLLTHQEECDLTVFKELRSDDFTHMAANPKNKVKKLICSSDFFEKHKDSLAKIFTLECVIKKSESGDISCNTKDLPKLSSPASAPTKDAPIENKQNPFIALMKDIIQNGITPQALDLVLQHYKSNTISLKHSWRYIFSTAHTKGEISAAQYILASLLILEFIKSSNLETHNLFDVLQKLNKQIILPQEIKPELVNAIAEEYSKFFKLNLVSDNIKIFFEIITQYINLKKYTNIDEAQIPDYAAAKRNLLAALYSAIEAKIASKASNDFLLLNTLITKLTELGDISGASKYFAKALKKTFKLSSPQIVQSISEMYYKLVICNILLGQYEQALNSAANALRIDTKNDDMRILFIALNILKKPLVITDFKLDPALQTMEFNPSVLEEQLVRECLEKSPKFNTAIASYLLSKEECDTQRLTHIALNRDEISSCIANAKGIRRLISTQDFFAEDQDSISIIKTNGCEISMLTNQDSLQSQITTSRAARAKTSPITDFNALLESTTFANLISRINLYVTTSYCSANSNDILMLQIKKHAPTRILLTMLYLQAFAINTKDFLDYEAKVIHARMFDYTSAVQGSIKDLHLAKTIVIKYLDIITDFASGCTLNATQIYAYSEFYRFFFTICNLIEPTLLNDPFFKRVETLLSQKLDVEIDSLYKQYHSSVLSSSQELAALLHFTNSLIYYKNPSKAIALLNNITSDEKRLLSFEQGDHIAYIYLKQGFYTKLSKEYEKSARFIKYSLIAGRLHKQAFLSYISHFMSIYVGEDTVSIEELAKLNIHAQTIKDDWTLRLCLSQHSALNTKYIELLLSQKVCDVNMLLDLGLSDSAFNSFLKNNGQKLSTLLCAPNFFARHFEALMNHKSLKEFGIKNIETGKTTYYDRKTIYDNSTTCDRFDFRKFNSFIGYSAIVLRHTQKIFDQNIFLYTQWSIANNTFIENIEYYRAVIFSNIDKQSTILLNKISAKALELFYNNNTGTALKMCQMALGYYLEEQPDHIYNSALAPIYAALSILNLFSGNKNEAYTYLLKAQVCNLTAHITITARIIYSISEDIMIAPKNFKKVASLQFRNSPFCLFYYFAIDKFLTKSGAIDERFQDLHNLLSAQALYNIGYSDATLSQYKEKVENFLTTVSYAKLAQKVRGLPDSEQTVKFDEDIISKFQSLLQDSKYINNYCYNIIDPLSPKAPAPTSKDTAPTSTSDPVAIISSNAAPGNAEADENANPNKPNANDYDAQTIESNAVLRIALSKNLTLSTKYIKLLLSQKECDSSMLYELGLTDGAFNSILLECGANLSRFTCTPKFFQTHFNSLSAHKSLKAIGIQNIETGKTSYYDTPAIFANSSVSNQYDVSSFNKFLGYTAIFSKSAVTDNAILAKMQSFIAKNAFVMNIVSYKNAIIVCDEKQLTKLLNKISAKALELFYNNNTGTALNMCQMALGYYLEEQPDHIYNSVLAPIYATLSILNVYSGNKAEADNNLAKAEICNNNAHITATASIIHAISNGAKASITCFRKVASLQFRNSPFCLFYYFAMDKFLTRSGKIDERYQDLENLFSAQALYSIAFSDNSLSQYKSKAEGFLKTFSYERLSKNVCGSPDSKQSNIFDGEIASKLQSLLKDSRYINSYCNNVIDHLNPKALTPSKASTAPSTT